MQAAESRIPVPQPAAKPPSPPRPAQPPLAAPAAAPQAKPPSQGRLLGKKGFKKGSGLHFPFHRPKRASAPPKKIPQGSPGQTRKSPSPSSLRRGIVAPETSLRPADLGIPAVGSVKQIKRCQEMSPPSAASPHAPLAESESSTIENSPAIEMPPGGFPGHWLAWRTQPCSPLVEAEPLPVPQMPQAHAFLGASLSPVKEADSADASPRKPAVSVSVAASSDSSKVT